MSQVQNSPTASSPAPVVSTKKQIKVKGKKPKQIKVKTETAPPMPEPEAGGSDAEPDAGTMPTAAVVTTAAVVGNPMPDLSDFQAEIALIAKQFDHKDSLTECKATVANLGIKVGEWRVKQYRWYLAGIESGLMDEVQNAMAGTQATMSRQALQYYTELVTLQNKSGKTKRNGRVPMAMNGRLMARPFQLLCDSLDVLPAALVHAQEEYTYDYYEKANALGLDPNVTDEELTYWMKNEFCHGWYNSEASTEALLRGEELYGQRKRAAKKPLTVEKATEKLMSHCAEDPEALAAMIATLQNLQARQTPSPQ